MMKTTPSRQTEPPLLEKHILIHKLKNDIYWLLIDFERIRNDVSKCSCSAFSA